MDATSAKGIIIINGRAYDAQKVIDAFLGTTYVDVKIDGPSLVIGNSRIQPVARSTQEMAMLRTCFGSLAYCCSPEKKCMDRDGALELLNLTIEDYQQIKSACHQMFVDTSKKITDSSLKSQFSSYQTTQLAEEEEPVSQTSQRKVDTGSYYWRSKGVSRSANNLDASSVEDRSYGPTDLSLIFGDPNKKDSINYPSDDSRRDRASSNWMRPGSTPSTLGSRGDEGETRWDSEDRCVHCRAQIPLGARYCPNCGESVY